MAATTLFSLPIPLHSIIITIIIIITIQNHQLRLYYMMKVVALFPLAALTSAFVIPDEVLTNQIIAESNKATQKSLWDEVPAAADVFSSAKDVWKDAVEVGENAIDTAFAQAVDFDSKVKTYSHCHDSITAFDVQAWLDSAVSTAEESLDLFDVDLDISDHPHHPPHHKKPHFGHHKKPTKTVYELINESEHTTKLAKIINKFPNLIEALNGTDTSSNFTFFAPTDKAFEKVHKHAEDVPDDKIYQGLLYHISKDFYPAGRVLATHTIPSLRSESALGDKQRLRVSLTLKGLTVNFYSRIVAVDIFGTNGVIHAVDSIIFPPPPAHTIIEALPGTFSTFQLALEKTGLAEVVRTAVHTGGTTFAPTNRAFEKLGRKVNAWLFSKYGQWHLEALLKYHIVANQTLYTDAFYGKKSDDEKEGDLTTIPKGRYHVDLQTLLEDRSLSIDIARFGGLITILINGFDSIQVQDGIAKDGVVQIVSSLLIPPKTPGVFAEEATEMSVEEFKARFEPYVADL